MRRALYLSALCVALVALVGSAMGRDNGDTSAGSEVSGLDGPSQQADRLPDELLATASVDQFEQPIDSEKVASQAGLDIYLVDGVGDSLCIVQAAGSGDDFASSTACSPTAVLESDGAITVQGYGVTPDYTVAGIAADGYDVASMEGVESAVDENVFVLQPELTGQLEELQLSGADVPTESVDVSSPLTDSQKR